MRTGATSITEQLVGDLEDRIAAALQRTEQAEAMCEAWRLNCESATRLLAELQLDRIQLRKDIAAASRERDAFRARLESAEAALREIREIIGIDDPMIQESLRRGYEFAIEVGQVKRLAELLDAALGAAGERSEDG